MQELALNSQYLSFVTDELIPKVESQYPISTRPEERGILGTSMGGTYRRLLLRSHDQTCSD